MHPEKLYFATVFDKRTWFDKWKQFEYEKYLHINSFTGDVTCEGPGLNFVKIDLTFPIPGESDESK